MKPAVFLDRDGVINVDVGYPHRIKDFEFIAHAPQAIARINASGRLAVVVTNQSGIARGLYEEADAEAFNAHIQEQLRPWGAHVDAFYLCPYHPDATVARYRADHPDRKPRPGMIERAIRDLGIDRAASFLIGDRTTDIQAAQAAGMPGYLFTGTDLDAFIRPLLLSSRAESLNM
ncbi:HAD family hydrolase [Gluconacetobacter entanii]|uniref:D,D-heptose 1,7-bisphosphate phosphatase n=1 Tax=Gluconacetobacter entanii TaxID=108528 RepID=A0A318PPK2_9PROT|nr:HAD family hydrolase [Gluconacetobacter entanii]MBE7620660.1 HAD-IIIA family hydrolase [Komagataeibacter sp. FXV2]MCE2579370.1 HAD family hydrolase [Komagataeibacter sp. FNDCR1]MBY4640614.1 HAD family hydrolase [Gluconacetobacter entanii]MCW4579107.1 HAD family hydrolase [Gluconacetobacter entanii]MCW4582500.1 HAD family hydrolase [Gluconacetobacter entanii]